MLSLPLFRTSPNYRWIVYFFSFATVSVTSGVVYGWPALRQQLQQVDHSRLSESALGVVFTAGAWSTQGCRFLTGLARDQWGCRNICCFSLLAVAAGILGLAWSDANNAVSLGCSLFVVGLGAGGLLCLQPVSGLFPQSSGSIMTSLSGAFQVSGLVFLVLTSLSSNRPATFSGFAALVLLLAVIAFMLLPSTATFDDMVPVVVAGDSAEGENGGALNHDASLEQLQDENPSEAFQGSKSSVHHRDQEQSQSIPEDNPNAAERIPAETERTSRTTLSRRVSSTSLLHDSLAGVTQRQQILSGEYVWLVLWVSFSTTPMQYYVGSLGFQLEEHGDDSGFYADMFSIIWAGSAVVSPGAGFLADRLGVGVSEALATVVAASSFFILAAAGRTTLDFQVVGLLLQSVGRVFVVGLYFVHLGTRFGYQNYGTLAGLGLLVSAIVSLLQYPLIAVAADGHAVAVNLVCGGTLLGLLPYCVWMARREHKEKQQEGTT